MRAARGCPRYLADMGFLSKRLFFAGADCLIRARSVRHSDGFPAGRGRAATRLLCATNQCLHKIPPAMPEPRKGSVRALETKRFETAMRSEPVQKLIRENATLVRISGLVGALPTSQRRLVSIWRRVDLEAIGSYSTVDLLPGSPLSWAVRSD